MKEMKSSQSFIIFFAGLVATRLLFIPGISSAQDEGVEEAPPAMSLEALHKSAIVCDLHADTQAMLWLYGYDLKKKHRAVDWGPAGVAPLFSDIDIPRARKGGLDLFTMAVCPSPKNNRIPGSAAFTRHALRAIEKALQQNQDELELVRSPKEARAAFGSGKLAVLLAIEGGQAIEENLDLLREYYDRGVRYMTVTHSKSLSWANSATDKPRVAGGLSDFGREVIREMERLGMMIDLAHVAEDTFWAVLAETDCPVIVSHAGARALADHPRNLTDEQIKAVAERGGVIGVIFHAGYLDPEGKKPRNAGLVADHIDHIKEVAGVDVIALGSDFDGGVDIPPELGDASRLPALTRELVRRGYDEREIRKILGGNFLLAWQRIESCRGREGGED